MIIIHGLITQYLRDLGVQLMFILYLCILQYLVFIIVLEMVKPHKLRKSDTRYIYTYHKMCII